MEIDNLTIMVVIFVIIVISVIVYIIYSMDNTNILVNKSITFTNTLATHISSIYVQDSNFNTYPKIVTAPIAPNEIINIIIPKSSLNSNITWLSVYCCPTPEIQNLQAISFVLINDNETIVYSPLVQTPYNKPTITSTSLSSTIIAPTIPPSCIDLCTNTVFPTTGYIRIKNNYNKPLFIGVITTSNTGINKFIHNASSEPGITITTNELNTGIPTPNATPNATPQPNLREMITCLSFDGYDPNIVFINCTIFYKLSNGKILKIVFGTSPSSILITYTQTPSNSIQNSPSDIPNSFKFLRV